MRRVVVAGAGVLGLAIALKLARAGCSVTIKDPALEAPNATAVAAGLLAPLGEVVFDPEAAEHCSLLSHAFSLWSDFSDLTGISVELGPTIIPRRLAGALRDAGAEVVLGRERASYSGDAHLLDPGDALRRLRSLAMASGASFQPHEVLAPEGGAMMIVAAGPGAPRLEGIAAELACLTPIKGQIAVLPNGPTRGPVHRWPGGYLVPQQGGARTGATMEIGRSDLGIDQAVIARLARTAAEHVPGLDISGAHGLAGVRMATPDGLPLVGPSRTPGVMLAVGARRNGWLLAPLVAEIIAAYFAGDDPGPWAQALHPSRFD